MTEAPRLAYFDTHAHVQEPEFDEDADAAIERAKVAGVLEMVVPAVDLESAQRSLALAKRHDGLYATAGFHPHDANRLTDEALAAVDAILELPNVVAVGEIGLDYFRLHSTREEQLEAIEKQLGLAEKHAKPVIVHCRDAWKDCEAVLAPWARRVASRFDGRPVGVLHYFSGDMEQAQFYVDLGFVISIHTSVTHPKQTQMREVAAAVPLESLVIETDSPYGSPQPYRGKRNEPAYVVEGAKRIALERGISETLVAEATTANARRLFRITGTAAAAEHLGAAREHASRH
ncbi:MAG: TatD family hydrolase [Dehalococcoidia bacterium]